MRRVLMLVTMVVLTASAGWSAGGTVYTYCEGVCEGTGQQVVYRCGYGVSAVTCCSRTRTNTCNGEFLGTCTGSNGTIGC